MRRGWGSPRRHPPPASPEAAALTAASLGTSVEASPTLPDSPSSPSMFELSPEVHLQGGLGASAAHGAFGSAAYTALGDDDGSEADSDDLTAFLAGLREKYGLQDATAAPRPGPDALLALAAPAEAAPSVRIRVHVTSTSTAGGGELPLPADAAMPQRSPSKEQHVSNEDAGAIPPQPPLPLPQPTPAAQQAEELQRPAMQQQDTPIPEPRPQLPQPQPEEHPQAEMLLDAELDAELSTLEELQRQIEAQQQAQGSEAAPIHQQQPGTRPQQGQTGPAAASLGSPAAASAACAVERHSSTMVEDAVESAQPAGPGAQPQLQLPWASLHELLVARGFPGLLPTEAADVGAGSSQLQQQQQPNPAALFTALHSLLQEQARAKQYQERLSEAAQTGARREGALVSSFTAAAKQRDAEIAKWKRLALDNQRAARDAQQAGGSLSQSREQLAADVRQMQGTVARLQAALHRKEDEVERVKAVLQQQREREERRAMADAEALARLKQSYAAAKAAELGAAPGGAAAVLKIATAELSLKPLDIVRIFEAERADLQEAAALAAADAQSARAELSRAQEALHAAGLPCDQFEEIEGQAREAARQAAAAEERAAAAEEEVAALRAELADRPTQAQLESLQRQVAIMERQAAKAAADKAAAEAKEASSRPKPKQLSTREMIQRDRNMQRLGLHCVEELPKPVLVEVVQDACALLECRQPLELCGAIRPVQELAALVPRMERFIGDVCGAVFQRGLAHVPEALRQDNPADVPAILLAWIAELGELLELRGVLRALLRQLGARVSRQPNDPPPTAGEVVPLVAQLVELERSVFHSREVLEAAEAALAAQPDILINRIVAQFQRLFACRSLEGVLPAMNKLYLQHTEAQTFLASLRTALGLEPSATLEACANGLEQALADRRGGLAAMLPAREPHTAAPALPPSATAVVVEVPPRAQREQELQAAAQVVVERMAAKRCWPKVEIFVQAGGAGQAQERAAQEGDSL
ncbi:basal body [Chlorella sorokiniana]|uniref:Centrosomal protein of 70 kDa n=1 Tax=Chlorella sorokiniana TaxID=3076 RepID=A0A2P6TS06_CHLSO|nr:basal body [Chlorella sorokiniana]|eukprot:PRW56849.1 basal body [Chlorella sorokiniana]